MKKNDQKQARTRLWTCLNSVLSICEGTATCSKSAADAKYSFSSSVGHKCEREAGHKCEREDGMEGNFIFKTILWTSEVVFILCLLMIQSRRERLHLVMIWRRVLVASTVDCEICSYLRAFEYRGDKSEHGAELNEMLTLVVRTLISHLCGFIPYFSAENTGTHTHFLAKVSSALGLI